MRSLILAGLVVSATVAQASFEMMLISDATNKVIHRYDPINRIYLGSFGAGIFASSPSALALDRANNRVFAVDGTNIHAFNYNTGARLATGSVSGSPINIVYRGAHQDLLAVNGTATISRVTLDSSGNIVGSSTWFTGSSGIHAITSDGTEALFYQPGTTVGTLTRAAGSATGTVTGSTGSASIASDVVRNIDMLANGRLMIADDTDDRVYTVDKSLTGGLGFVNLGALGAIYVAGGHGMTAFALGSNAGVPSMQPISVLPSSPFASPVAALPTQIANVNGVAMVLAPEPGTMVAFASGLLVIARRRKATR